MPVNSGSVILKASEKFFSIVAAQGKLRNKKASQIFSATLSSASDEVRIFFQKIFQRGQLDLVHVAGRKFRAADEIFSVLQSFLQKIFVDAGKILEVGRSTNFFQKFFCAAHAGKVSSAVYDSRQSHSRVSESLGRLHVFEFADDRARPRKIAIDPIEIIAVKNLLEGDGAQVQKIINPHAGVERHQFIFREGRRVIESDEIDELAGVGKTFNQRL